MEPTSQERGTARDDDGRDVHRRARLPDIALDVARARAERALFGEAPTTGIRVGRYALARIVVIGPAGLPSSPA
jgi:hypothetical protein